MDERTFHRAVISLKNFPRMVGIIGGEPTLHPEFSSFVEFYAAHVGDERRNDRGRDAILDFARYRAEYLSDMTVKRGLWTSLGSKYYEHFELIQEVFDYQCINDHINPGLHQALLISRKSLNISDDLWVDLRNNCWIQNLWSATITPKGAFFCEVAGALDMLFDGPGGWPIESDWWKRTPDDFGQQLKWCELCSAPLSVPRRRVDEKMNDVSKDNLERLIEIDSPSVRQNRIIVFDETTYSPDKYKSAPSSEWYLPDMDNQLRVSDTNKSLFMKKLEGVVVCVGLSHHLEVSLPYNVGHFDRLVVVTSPEDTKTQELVNRLGATLVISSGYKKDGAPFNKGAMLNEGLKALAFDDWVLFLDADIVLPPTLRTDLEKLVLNPGCLYYTARNNIPAGFGKDDVLNLVNHWDRIMSLPAGNPDDNRMPWGYFQLFNVQAHALREKGRELCCNTFISAGAVDNNFQNLWPWSKKKPLPVERRQFNVLHLSHGGLGKQWCTCAISSQCRWWFIGLLTPAELITVNQLSTKAEAICIARIDTGDKAILRLPKDHGGRFQVPGWSHHGRYRQAFHGGLFSRSYKIPHDHITYNRVVVHSEFGCEYSGWGFGHVKWENNRQGCCWNGQMIEPTEFELSEIRCLSDNDTKYLVNF